MLTNLQPVIFQPVVRCDRLCQASLSERPLPVVPPDAEIVVSVGFVLESLLLCCHDVSSGLFLFQVCPATGRIFLRRSVLLLGGGM